jgi:hypothetical protein
VSRDSRQAGQAGVGDRDAGSDQGADNVFPILHRLEGLSTVQRRHAGTGALYKFPNRLGFSVLFEVENPVLMQMILQIH